MVGGRRIASGFEKGKPVYGFASKAILSGVSSRRTQSFIFFGGYVGEGNVTYLLNLSDNITTVNGGVLELDAGADIDLLVNDVVVGRFLRNDSDETFSTPNRYTLSAADLAGVVSGTNKIDIRFLTTVGDVPAVTIPAIAGGYLRIDYDTNSIDDPAEQLLADNNTKRSWYHFPGVDGFINVYDAFYVPGNLSGMSIFLHYQHSYIMVMTIGNVVVYQQNSSGNNETSALTNETIAALLAAKGWSYANLSEQTVPIRIGFVNVSRQVAPFDSVLMTDVSNSMDRRLDSEGAGIDRACNDSLINDPSTSRLSAAKCAGHTYVDTILQNTGPRLGLMSYSTDWTSLFPLSTDSDSLHSEINTYTKDVATCMCCAINKLIEMFANNSDIYLVARGSSGWRYLANGSDPVGNWSAENFSATNWGSGVTSFGSGTYASTTTLTSHVGNYYFRKTFEVTAANYSQLQLLISSDDYSAVYINGILVDNDTAPHASEYWNKDLNLSGNLLHQGINVLAVKLYNGCAGGSCKPSSMYFDAELRGLAGNGSFRSKSAILMSDGDTNQQCQSEQGTGSASGDAVAAACAAFSNSSIRIYTVGLGYEAGDVSTLQSIADCAGGQYFNASNAASLSQVYQSIAELLISYTETQRLNTTSATNTKLYPDSFIQYDYTPAIAPPGYGSIPVSIEGTDFGNTLSQGILNYPSTSRLRSVRAISYSGDSWTDYVSINGPSASNVVAYNISTFSKTYRDLGDPYVIQLPPKYFAGGADTSVLVHTGLSPTNATPGSTYDKLIYQIDVSSQVGFGGSYFSSEGCSWTLTFADGTTDVVKVPSDYAGERTCDYATATYDSTNALDDAAYRLFQSLDFDKDGILTMKFDQNMLELDTVTTPDVPTLWGPATMEVRLW